MLGKETTEMTPEISAKLAQLLTLLTKNEVIQAYKEIEAKVSDHPSLFDLTEEIKIQQKKAVEFAHYGKPVAEQRALKKADQLTQEFEEHPLVIRYRECLLEANILLQHVTKLLEEQVNTNLELSFEDQLAKKLEEKE